MRFGSPPACAAADLVALQRRRGLWAAPTLVPSAQLLRSPVGSAPRADRIPAATQHKIRLYGIDAQEQYTAESGAELKSRCHELTLEKRNRGKYGQPLANDYRLNLSTSCKKGKIKGADSVAQDNTAVLPRTTPLCCPRQHRCVAHGDTNRRNNSQSIRHNKTDTEHRRIGFGF